MPDISQYTGYRGGVVYRAAEVNGATVHSWPLAVGTSTGGGHPRYDFLDIVDLSLMRILTAQIGVPASRAGPAIEAARPELHAAVKQLAAEFTAAGRWRREGGPFFLLPALPSDTDPRADLPRYAPLVVGFGGLSELFAFHDNEFSVSSIVALPPLVCRSLMRLEYVLDSRKPACEDD
ncbi:hypothetical protein GVO57_09390 [Sphingomonas changnyeongensis]|uniref:MerR family transcriptional regulator n=1 Tax=Sphingomonas changnyeongensis TaxID=2698679 RepID=A0A7Z2NWC0_9SPHN|nr:hypothetical protein [Sphingomonas changnyeongensis]QHL90995.1 hypothetical protein GVO57_09390 [Sphingomonas changnyeongensis]